MMLVMHGFIFSVHTLKEPQIVIDFVPLVLSRHAVIAERLSVRLLILQSVFSVGGVWPQPPSRFRNAICHASGMQARVWLVRKHPSRLGMQLKFPVYKKCLQLHVRNFVVPSAVAVLAVSLSRRQDGQKL